LAGKTGEEFALVVTLTHIPVAYARPATTL